MKTRTIFEGVINGQAFDNVKEYNKVLCELLDKGETVDAQTSTRTVNEDKVESIYDDIEMLPGFENDDDNYDYVDNYIKDTLDETIVAVDDLKKELGDKLEAILNKIDTMYYNDVVKYDEDVQDVLIAIEEDIEYINSSQKILKVWKDFYTSIFEVLSDKLEIKHLHDDSAQVKSKEEDTVKQLEDDLSNALIKLVEQVPSLQKIINSLGLK